MKSWNNARGSGTFLKIELLDDRGGEIAACFFKESAKSFTPPRSGTGVHVRERTGLGGQQDFFALLLRNCVWQWRQHPALNVIVKVFPPFGAGKNLLPIRNCAMAVTRQDEKQWRWPHYNLLSSACEDWLEVLRFMLEIDLQLQFGLQVEIHMTPSTLHLKMKIESDENFETRLKSCIKQEW